MLTEYFNQEANARHYYAYKELKLAVDAARYFDIDARRTQQIVLNAGLDRETIRYLNFNKYKPIMPTEQYYKNFQDKNVQGPMGTNTLKYHIAKLNRAYTSMPMINISFTDETELEDYTERTVPREQVEFLRNPPNVDEAKERLSRVEGGLIETEEDIPKTKDNPAERINPLTGMPYMEDDNI